MWVHPAACGCTAADAGGCCLAAGAAVLQPCLLQSARALHINHKPQACYCCFYPPPADIIGSVTLLVVKGDERVGSYRQQMQHLQAYAQMNALPQVRGAGCSAGGKG